MKKTKKNEPQKRNSRTLSEARRSGMKRSTIAPGIQYDNETKKFIVEFYYGQVNGKAVRKHKTFSDRKDAEEALIKFKAQKIDGLSPAIGRAMSLNECIEEYISRSLALNRIEETTAYSYRKTLNHLAGTALGSKKISEIQSKDIENYLLLLKEATSLKNVTINKDLELIRTVYRYAIQQKYVKENPALTVEKLRKERFEENPLTIEEIQALEKALLESGDWTLIVMGYLGVFQGLRRGEILGLKWSNISFKENTFQIRDTRTQAGNKIVEKDTKTPKSNRYCYMIPKVREILLQYMEYQKENGIFGKFVLVTSKGTPYYPTTPSTKFKKFLEKNNLTEQRLHGLRHTFATQSIQHGVSVNAVSGALGHSSVATTLSFYVHQSREASKDVCDIMKDVF